MLCSWRLVALARAADLRWPRAGADESVLQLDVIGLHPSYNTQQGLKQALTSSLKLRYRAAAPCDGLPLRSSAGPSTPKPGVRLCFLLMHMLCLICTPYNTFIQQHQEGHHELAPPNTPATPKI